MMMHNVYWHKHKNPSLSTKSHIVQSDDSQETVCGISLPSTQTHKITYDFDTEDYSNWPGECIRCSISCN